jgi:hypothetical protein
MIGQKAYLASLSLMMEQTLQRIWLLSLKSGLFASEDGTNSRAYLASSSMTMALPFWASSLPYPPIQDI